VVVLLLSCVAAVLAAHRNTNERFDAPGHTENGLDENNQIPAGNLFKTGIIEP
jgi:hypothetical protein